MFFCEKVTLYNTILENQNKNKSTEFTEFNEDERNHRNPQQVFTPESNERNSIKWAFAEEII